MRTNGERRGALSAAAIGIGALGVGELIAASRGDSLIDAIGRVMADTAPVPVVETTVALSGKHDKAVTRLGVGAGAVAATAGLGALSDQARTPAVAAFGAAAAALGFRRPTRSPATVAGAAAAAGVLGLGLRRRPRRPFGALLWAGAGAGLLTGARALIRDYDRRQRDAIRRVGPLGGISMVPQDGLEGEPGLSPLITANRSFYVADVNLSPPRIDPTRWRLAVTGKVAHPLRLSLAELATDAVEFDAVMVCVHNRPGERRAGNGRWYGVPLAELLEHAIPETGATRLVTRAVDGYTISLPVEPLRCGAWPGYLVIGVNGEPLAPEHGFPARVFVPGLYGQYTGAKWLAELELTDDSHIDYWWKRGWPSEPIWVTPQARIDVTAPGRAAAGSTTIAGVAWAPPHGVEAVELRIDEGDWRPVDLGTELAPAAWRRWRTTVDLPAGEHTIQARAISRSGEIQDGISRSPFPSGPTGLHSVTLEI
ncbi:molybdopterin-dependent oxidoreductase [Nocardia anaemiae]|uniref:molybdopterin-dependent oxidoreductase n=1 Tax=Nocardia anaemiae TaxID=263910 RepID=UPI0007A41D4B|nr:molybdopterin-dependent oxidoreductase [Nocardia anaemiae]